MRRLYPFMAAVVFFALGSTMAHAHPVPKDNHDRNIVVRLKRAAEPGKLAVQVDYRLEVDETTVIVDDLRAFEGEIDFTRFRGKELQLYDEFARRIAPIYADRLVVRVDGKPVPLKCTARSQRLKDEKEQALGHLRCDFVFTATFAVQPGKNTLTFREVNYLFQPGQIDLSFVDEAKVQIVKKMEPDEALKKRAAVDQGPGDDNRLRELRIEFLMPAAPPPTPTALPVESEAAPASSTTPAGLWLVLGLLVAGIGLRLTLKRFAARA